MAKNSLVKSSIAFALAGSFALFPLIGVSPANAAPGGLCAVNSDYAEEDWITNLTLGNGTALAVAQGETYKDASAQSVGTYAAGTSNSISLTINVNIADQGGDDWDEHVFVWLDLNQNGVVDLAEEEIFEAHAMTSTFSPAGADPNILAHTFTGTFTVPVNAYNGTVYGRAMLQYIEPNGTPIMCNSNPNAWDPGVSAFEAGTVLDFKVELTGGIENPQLAATGSDYSGLLAIAAGLLALGGGALTVSIRRNRL